MSLQRSSRCGKHITIWYELNSTTLHGVTWREYHDSTKHTPDSLRRSRHVLNWANMPDPFRHYEGVPVFDLPADPPVPEIPALELLCGESGTTDVTDGAEFLSQLLFYSAAVSASKRVPSTGARYALRVNPSSGNLHPTEFHFVTRGLKDWPDGLYHYRASSHMAEQRRAGSFPLPVGSAPIVFILTSIIWREAWKYGERAYRYCLHDIGHAWQALALSARAIGWESRAIGDFVDDEIAGLCALDPDESPMLLISLNGPAIPIPQTKFTRTESARSFGEVARMRRSALDFIGTGSMSLAQLSAILEAASMLPSADFAATRLIQLYLYVHRVEGLEPGVYRHCARTGKLQPIRLGDQRVMAAGLSLGQDLAGNACVAFSMIADLEQAARSYGDRGYRYAHFEAGAIGQRLYLAAEALGLRATGIGAFFDDEVNRYLALSPEQGQVVYHFAIGHPVPDTRLEARP
jgi:SagB-type dehydrogenase family enzyme